MKAPARNAVFTSVVAGQLAGLCMAAAMMLTTWIVGAHSPWRALQVLGGLVVGDSALRGPDALIAAAGWMAHQSGPSYLWSRLFGLLVGYARTPIGTARAVLSGLAIGITAELIDVYVLMPSNPNGHIWFENVPRVADWIWHLIFGAALGLFYRWMQERARTPTKLPTGRSPASDRSAA